MDPQFIDGFLRAVLAAIIIAFLSRAVDWQKMPLFPRSPLAALGVAVGSVIFSNAIDPQTTEWTIGSAIGMFFGFVLLWELILKKNRTPQIAQATTTHKEDVGQEETAEKLLLIPLPNQKKGKKRKQQLELEPDDPYDSTT